MWHKYRIMLLSILMVMLLAWHGLLWAQDNPAESTAEPPTEAPAEPTDTPAEEPRDPVELAVTGTEPKEIRTGEERTLSIFGQNFTAETTVRIINFGLLDTTFVSDTALTAIIPASIPAGDYRIEAIDSVNGSAESPDELRVRRPPAPDESDPTDEPDPTPIPGRPSLVTRNFTANPAVVRAGGSTTLTFEIVNQGNRNALGVAVTVDPSGSFVPANGQAGVPLPDLVPGAVTTVTLSVVAKRDAPEGPANVPLTLTYRDFEGENFSETLSLGVIVEAVIESAQVTLARYLVEPSPVEPGAEVTVTVLVTNTGNDTANQVLLRLGGEDSVLLPHGQGDSFPVGDLSPGASISLDLPMILSDDAEAGAQMQPFTLSFLREEEIQESSGSITIPVAEVIEPEALLLLESYDAGDELLQPGDRFSLALNLLNAGDADALNLLVTFGTVNRTPGSSSDDDDSSSGDDTTTTTSDTTPSTVFAPIGSGGTFYAGTLAGDGGRLALEQEFVVNGTTESGIYNLPITLRYDDADGDQRQENLQASFVVVAPPRLQTNLETPLPTEVNVGEPLPLTLNVVNTGTDDVLFTTAQVTAENGEIIEGAEVFIGNLDGDDDAAVSPVVIPLEEGTVRISIALNYVNDLNQPAQIVLDYETQAVVPPPPPEEPLFPPDVVLEPTEPPQQEDILGRVLLGLLGLGS
jgi:hypothetical protein